MLEGAVEEEEGAVKVGQQRNIKQVGDGEETTVKCDRVKALHE